MDEKKRPEIGKRFKVTVSDCCIEVEFEATLLFAEYPEDSNVVTKWGNGVELRTLPGKIGLTSLD